MRPVEQPGRPYRGLLILLTVCLFGVVACNRDERPRDETPGSSESDNAGGGKGGGESGDETRAKPTERKSDPGYVLQDHNEGAAIGQNCHQDQECIQPLRCLELTCSVPPAVLGEGTSPASLVLDPGGKNEVEVQLEVADTSFERQRGLMFRTTMADNWGMLFVFNQSRPRSFWMKNTYLPLDIVFISEDGEIVAISEHAKPLDVGPRYESGKPARYVLELNGGYTGRHGIRPGQKVKLKNVPGRHSTDIQ